MLTICETDAAGVFTGRTATIGEADGCPPAWVRANTPELPDSKVARWAGDAWAIIDPPLPPPEPVPETISSRQFFQQLAIEGVISEDDALAYVSTGVLPKAMLDAIGQLPAEQQFAVKMAVIGANTFDRHNPMTAQLGMILGKDDAALDELWQKAFVLP